MVEVYVPKASGKYLGALVFSRFALQSEDDFSLGMPFS